VKSTIEINRHIQEFEKMLDKYSSYQSFLRSIKLNSIMGTKSKFTISEMNPSMSISLSNSETTNSPHGSIGTVFTITDMSFIIDKNLNVGEIELVYEVCNERLLNEVKDWISDIKISPKFSLGGVGKEYQVSGFFIEI
jgi:hypothetical protein